MRGPTRRQTERALDELRGLAANGIAPNAYALLPEHAALVEELVASFGSLGAARDAARLPRGVAPPTRETVIASLHALADRGIRLAPKQLRRLGEDALVKGCYAFFGSVPAARDAAGLAKPTRPERPIASKADVLAALMHLAGPEHKLQAKDVRGALALDACHHFGTVTAAIASAGLTRPLANQRWTRESLIAAIEARRASGHDVSWGGLKRDGRSDLASAIMRRLGGKIPGVVTTGRTGRRLSSQGATQKRRGVRRPPAQVARHDSTDLRGQLDALVGRIVADVFAAVADAARRELVRAFTAKHARASDDGRAGTPARIPPRATRPASARYRPPRSGPVLALDVERVQAVLAAVASQHALTPREAQVLAAVVHGIPRARIAGRLGTSENTISTQVRTLLKKVGHGTLAEAAWWVRTKVEQRAAVGHRPSGTPRSRRPAR